MHSNEVHQQCEFELWHLPGAGTALGREKLGADDVLMGARLDCVDPKRPPVEAVLTADPNNPPAATREVRTLTLSMPATFSGHQQLDEVP